MFWVRSSPEALALWNSDLPAEAAQPASKFLKIFGSRIKLLFIHRIPPTNSSINIHQPFLIWCQVASHSNLLEQVEALATINALLELQRDWYDLPGSAFTISDFASGSHPLCRFSSRSLACGELSNASVRSSDGPCIVEKLRCLLSSNRPVLILPVTA